MWADPHIIPKVYHPQDIIREAYLISRNKREEMISALRQMIYGLVPYDIVLTDGDIRRGRIAVETSLIGRFL